MSKGRINRWLIVLLALSAGTNVYFWPDGRAIPDRPHGSGTASVVGTEPARAAADDVDKLGLLRSLEDEHLRAARELADQYWAGGGAYQVSYAHALADGLRTIREQLVAAFGSEAEDDPMFRSLFRPLDPMGWFLTSDQQLAIQELRLERDAALQAAARDAARPGRSLQPGTTPAGNAATAAIAEQYQSGLAAILDDDVLLELELRESPTAQQLRASDLGLSEREFRETYSLMAGLGGGRTEPAATLATREALRDLLGPRRFAALWAARDPFFAEIGQIVERHGLPESTALGVYEVMGEFQDRRIGLAATAARDPDRAARDAMALADEERAALARLTGPEVAEEIVRGRALQSFRLFGGSGPPALADVAPRN